MRLAPTPPAQCCDDDIEHSSPTVTINASCELVVQSALVPQCLSRLESMRVVVAQAMRRPAVSVYGHVLGMATWSAVLADSCRCPFTQQPLQRNQVGRPACTHSTELLHGPECTRGPCGMAFTTFQPVAAWCTLAATMLGPVCSVATPAESCVLKNGLAAQVTLLTLNNIERFRERLILP